MPVSRHLALAGIALLLGLPKTAAACSIPAPGVHEIDATEQQLDTTSPSPPTIDGVSVGRGKGPDCEGLSSSMTSCDDVGTIRIDVRATDDRSDDDRIGYQLRLESGELPEGLSIPSAPVPASSSGRLQFWWTDGDTDDQEPVDFSLTIAAVDAAGNRSEPVSVAVRDEGSGCNCTFGGGVPALPLVFAALPLLSLFARRRWRCDA